MSYTNGLDKPTIYFNTVLYTGTGSTQSITSLDFQPDWVSIKKRSAAGSGNVYDSVRGALKHISTNLSAAEETESSGAGLTAFGSNGFTVGTEPTGNGSVNQSSQTYVAWNWKAGTSFTNDASATGIGSLDSSGSVNEEAGFAIVSYTGNETASTLKHGLSTVPQVIIVKGRIAARDWIVGHHTQGWTKSAMLNETTAYSDQTHWNNTAPTSSVFTIEGGTNSNVNTNSAAYIAYVFSERQGYSKFGSYTGNGNDDGTFSFCGFKPSFVLTKRTDSAGSWVIQDNKRPGYNETSLDLNPNNSEAEESNNGIDMLSNGFKQRNTDAHTNASGGNYIFYAVAESPFVTSTGVPATAR